MSDWWLSLAPVLLLALASGCQGGLNLYPFDAGGSGTGSTTGAATGSTGATSTGGTSGTITDAGPQFLPIVAGGGEVSALLSLPAYGLVFVGRAPFANGLGMRWGAVGGLFVYSDAGWTDLSSAIPAATGGPLGIQLLASDACAPGAPCNLYAVTSYSGVVTSADLGVTWRFVGNPPNVLTAIASPATGVLLGSDFDGIRILSLANDAGWQPVIGGHDIWVSAVPDGSVIGADFLAANSAGQVDGYTLTGQDAGLYSLCGSAATFNLVGGDLFTLGQGPSQAFVHDLQTGAQQAFVQFPADSWPSLVAHDSLGALEYFASGGSLTTEEVQAPSGGCAIPPGSPQSSLSDPNSAFTALTPGLDPAQMLAGTTRAILDVTAHSGSIAPTPVAGWNQTLMSLFAAGTSRIYAMGDDFRVYQLSKGTPTALAPQPEQQLPAVGLEDLCAADDNQSMVLEPSPAGLGALYCATCASAPTWVNAGTPPDARPGAVHRLRDRSAAHTSTPTTIPRSSSGVPSSQVAGSTTWTTIGSPAQVDVITASPPGTTLHPQVYLLSATDGCASSSDGVHFSSLGNLPSSASQVVTAAVSSVDGNALAFSDESGDLYTCENTGAALSCTVVSSVGRHYFWALTYDAAGDLWAGSWAASIFTLYDVTSGESIYVGDLVLSLGATPAVPGRGGLYVAGADHSWLLTR